MPVVAVAEGTGARDTLGVHLEIGLSGESSNELFYEQTYTDTTFLGRRLHGTPEGHTAGLATLHLAGCRDDNRWEFELRPELMLGDARARAAGSGTLRFNPSRAWRVSLDPRFEFSRDSRFDLERRERLLGAALSLRRRLAGGADLLGVRLAGEMLDTPGSTDPFLLSRREARGSIQWDHDAFPGIGWIARYETSGRAFPDSSSRDHVEHRVELAARREFLGGHSLSADATLSRRSALNAIQSTRDRFLETSVGLTGTGRFSDDFTISPMIQGEALSFDQPDSTADFDYLVSRAEIAFRRDLNPRLSLALVTRAHLLSTRWAPAEEYREASAGFELEVLGRSTWWEIEPEVGWRAYDRSEGGATSDPGALHSTYRFAEVQMLADQPLPGRLRARLMLSVRDEHHDDPSQNSQSFYFSVDLRRLF